MITAIAMAGSDRMILDRAVGSAGGSGIWLPIGCDEADGVFDMAADYPGPC